MRSTREFRIGDFGRVTTLAVILLCVAHAEAFGQERGGRSQSGVEAGVTVTLSTEARAQIRAFYSSRPATGAEALPPGIRRNLERGKPLPPGIAKKSAPQELQGTLELADGLELIEVGLDVLLVEVATGLIHDVLSDLIR